MYKILTILGVIIIILSLLICIGGEILLGCIFIALGIFLIFISNKLKNKPILDLNQEKEKLEKEVEELTTKLNDKKTLVDKITKDVMDANKEAADKIIQDAKNEANKIINSSELMDVTREISKRKNELMHATISLNEKKKLIIETDEEILMQDFGLYKPRYNLMNAEAYKIKLAEIREKQKNAIKNNIAVTGNTDWTVNNSKAQGTKMVKDTQKLLLRAFNSECDELVNNVKYNNLDSFIKRITSSKDAISKLGTIMNITITEHYYSLKLEELYLAYEYQAKKQEEKEELKEARAQMREETRLQKELEEQRKKIEKEQTHYQQALTLILKQLENAGEDEKEELMARKLEIESNLANIENSLKDIDYREANQKAGYVYIISNIGAFGENVYKIGMTRRLDPQERVDELGDASVPFNFDVHAMIFSDNAPALENALHKAFENKKVNMLNQRKEFFNVTLEEIKQVVKNNFDKTVEFIDIPEAEQFRVSNKLKVNNA